MRRLSALVLPFAASTLLAADVQPEPAPKGAWAQHWNRGKAEITTYSLEQARYGAVHPGTAATIFVTEPFSTTEQVKADKAGAESTQVLKLNLTKNFVTGIYPYSMMLSVFTPVARDSHPRSLKATVSAQEWCGHTFLQLNLEPDGYRGILRSYFQSEGDRDFNAGAAMLEDEIWTLIRIAPANLPTGPTELIPGGLHARLSHRLPAAEKAIASLAGEGGTLTYTIQYPDLKRTLAIRFATAFPHEIAGWEESGPSGFGDSEKILTTRAVLKERLMIDYWNKNAPAERALRRQLGLAAE